MKSITFLKDEFNPYKKPLLKVKNIGNNKPMKVYIQNDFNQLEDDWLFSAYLGAKKLGMDIIFFKEDEVDSIPKNQFVIAFVETTIKYFELNGIKYPTPLNIPEELKKYAKRETKNAYLSDIISYPEIYKFPLFIKPANKLKACPSGVVKEGTHANLMLLFSDVKNKTMLVETSPVVSMESEYRAFINKGEIVGLKHYSGSFVLFPDISIIKNMIKDYTSSPISYTLDVAITDKNDTILVECNDAWSIGSYGLDEKVYIRLLIDRWKELINVSNNKS